MGERGAVARQVRRWAPMAPIAAGAALAVLLTIAHVFPDGSLNLDEVAYDSQARAFADGQVTLPGDTHLPHFRPYLSGVVDNEVVFKYQPLWPATIASARTIGLGDTGLRAAMGAAGAIGVGWFAYELTRRRRVACISAAIVAATPFLWLQAATLLAYHPSLVHVSFAGALLLRAGRVGSTSAGVAAGALGATGLLLRPFDSAMVLGTIGIYVLLRAGPDRLRLALRIGAGSLPLAGVALLYNHRVTGSPFRTAFNTAGGADRFGFGPRASFIADPANPGVQEVYDVATAIDATGRSLLAVLPFLVAGPALIALAARTLLVRRAEPSTRLLAVLASVIVVGYGFWWGIANLLDFGLHESHGPAYHYGLLLAVVPLAALSADRITQGGHARALPLLVIGAVLWAPVNFLTLSTANDAGEYRSMRVHADEVDGPAVVLRRPEFPDDPYVRVVNQPDLQGPVVVALDTGADRLPIYDAYPTHDIHVVLDERELGDAFGPTHQRSEVATLLTAGESIVLQVEGQTPGEPRPDVFVVSAAGVRWFDGPTAEVTLTADDIVRHGDIHVGVGHRFADGSARIRYGCRFDVDRQPEVFRLLTICNGYHNYIFPNGAQGVSYEDVRSVLLVEPILVDGRPTP